MNKELIIFIIAVLFALVFGYMFYSMEKARQEELNVCAKEYGKKGFERACCWKKDFIDSTGDMRHLNCTNIHRDIK